MISKRDLQTPRTPSELSAYVLRLKETVRTDPEEFKKALLKEQLYKEFLDELVPLSCFALLEYPEDHLIELVLGNQGHDAIVYDADKTEVDRVELTCPQNGREKAMNRRRVVERGFSEVQVGEPGFDFEALIPHVLKTCQAKALKVYRECSLVVAIEPMHPFEGFEQAFDYKVGELVSQMRKIEFQAKRVYLLLLPNRLERVL